MRRLSGHNVADIWTQGAKYYEHLYACCGSMGGGGGVLGGNQGVLKLVYARPIYHKKTVS